MNPRGLIALCLIGAGLAVLSIVTFAQAIRDLLRGIT